MAGKPPPSPEQVQALMRSDIATMEPYIPIVPFEVLGEKLGRPVGELVKLDANENPYGPSPLALYALAELGEIASIYPDPEARRLRAMLADYVGVSAAHILVGMGADELIDLTVRLFAAPGDSIIDCPPSFGMYPWAAAVSGARLVGVPRRADFSLDVGRIERAARESGAKLLFLCSPNNPDGGLVDQTDLDRLLRLPLVVVLDEAYVEFSGTASAAKRVPDASNLVVLRTFSKWAALAGLRVGYGIYPLALIDHLWKIKQPYNLNVAADAAARGSLTDLPVLLEQVERIASERDRLIAALTEIPYLSPYPSRANFVLCKVSGVGAAALKRRLAEEHGILIRYFDKPGLRDHVRISAGKPEHTDRLLAALREIGETS